LDFLCGFIISDKSALVWGDGPVDPWVMGHMGDMGQELSGSLGSWVTYE